MSERYGRGRLKDMIIDLLLRADDTSGQVAASRAEVLVLQRRVIQLQEQHAGDLEVVKFWKAAAEDHLRLDVVTNATAAQNGPANDEQV